MQDSILSTDAALSLQWKHSKLMRDLDRLVAMLPPETARRYFRSVRVTIKGKKKRAFCLNGKAWPLLFLHNANKVELRFAIAMLDGMNTCYSGIKYKRYGNVFAIDIIEEYPCDTALSVTGTTSTSSGRIIDSDEVIS